MASNKVDSINELNLGSYGELYKNQNAVRTGCMLRIVWMLIGNIALLAMAAVISEKPRWTLSFVDVAYFGLVALLIAIRYIDIMRFQGTTAKNEPATRQHRVRYSIGLTLIALVVWIGVQSV